MSNKTVYIVLVIILIAIVSYVFGWFGNEPLFSPFEATVSLQNAPPTVLGFVAVIEEPDDVSTLPGTIQGDAGGTEGTGTVDVRFRFTVQDPDGVDDIPGLGGVPITPGNVLVLFREPANDGTQGTNIVVVQAGDCSAQTCVGNPDCVDQSPTTDEKEYICDMAMAYFDPPSPNGGLTADDRWTFAVSVLDTSNNPGTAGSGDPGFDEITCTGLYDCDYMIYNDITGVSVSPPNDALSWPGVDINAEDEEALTGLDLDNVGNVPISDESVEGHNLVEDGVPANYLEVDAFSGGDSVGGPNSGACDAPGGGGFGSGGVILDDAVPRTIVVPIPYTGGGTDSSSMYFCIWEKLFPDNIFGETRSDYVANDANLNTWGIIFNP